MPATVTNLDLSTGSPSDEVRHVLSACPVLRATVERVRTRRRIDHDTLVALRHSLGHLHGGPAFLNALFRSLPGVRPDHLLRGRLGGPPISCRKLHRRLPDDERWSCRSCSFATAEADYPAPTLHVLSCAPGRW